MKNIKWLVIPLSFWLLAACGNANDEVTETPENAPTEGTTDNNGDVNNGTTNNGTTDNGTANNDTNGEGATNNNMANGNNAVTNGNYDFDFTEFSLDVDYSATKEFEVDYENDESGVEASYKDDVNNEKLYGNDAYGKIESMFKSFKFDKNTPEDEVISEVLKAFNLPEDYQQFELEVHFADGTEKEYYKVK